MPKKVFSAEQIITKLRQIEVAMSQGKTAAISSREAGISEQSYSRWRKAYGGLQLDPAKRLKELERENARLKRVVADLSLERPCSRRWPRKTSRPPSGAGRLRGCCRGALGCPSA